MKVCILLVLGVIACNLGVSNSFKMIRYLDDDCRLPERFRRITWNCIEDNSPSDERDKYKGVAQCFNVDSFVDVMNRMCGKTENEYMAMIVPHEACLNNLNVDDSDEPSVDLAVVVECVRNKLD
ncbi:uncharacterized protein LOC111633070 [Centruroides sculpturatus]|uniref:uncharacterized protein LOC111633070 n=1 Tax=Centruroides sculpturatus TaxID=218467 RepID=UPI000C6E0254|nr:uncharacterized protein LOC111633070 [Centruroides sculpturatus]